jgi:hypothetical protein
VSIFHSYNFSVALEHVKGKGDIFSRWWTSQLETIREKGNVQNFREAAGNVGDGGS